MDRFDDLNSVLMEDHRELRQLLTELEQLTVSEPLWRSLTDLLIAETVRHAVAEDAYLYPVAYGRLPEGQQIAARYFVEHGLIIETLQRLERHDLPGAELSLLLSRLDNVLCPHMQDEEEELFPRLAEHLSTEELADLGRRAVEAKEKASIQQQLSGPDRPLRDTIIASGAGLVERVRNYLRGGAYPL